MGNIGSECLYDDNDDPILDAISQDSQLLTQTNSRMSSGYSSSQPHSKEKSNSSNRKRSYSLEQLVRQRQEIKKGCFAIQITGVKFQQPQIEALKKEFPGFHTSSLQLSVRLLGQQILLKTVKELIKDSLIGEVLEVQGNFFLFNCPTVSCNESVCFQLIVPEAETIQNLSGKSIISQENINVVADKKLRLDGLILNDSQTKQFELYPVESQTKGAVSQWKPICKFNASINFELDKTFTESEQSEILHIEGFQQPPHQNKPMHQFALRRRITVDQPKRKTPNGSQVSMVSNMELPMNEINEVPEAEDQSISKQIS